MTASFGRSRRVLPAPNLGAAANVQRRLEQEASRAAQRTRVAVSVDAYPARLWLRTPRSTIPCACSAGKPGDAGSAANVQLTPGEGDYLELPDSGYRVEGPKPAAGDDLPEESVSVDSSPAWLGDLTRMLMGNGKRCGLCWGTGWIDGYRLWGGYRFIACAVDTVQVKLVDESGIMVDTDSPTPTFVGPGYVVWDVEVPRGNSWVDALRVRAGLQSAVGDFVLEARTSADAPDTWRPAEVVLGLSGANVVGSSGLLPDDAYSGLQLRLTLSHGVRASHAELVVRSESLVNTQLQQLQQAASQELIAPQISIEFELDPVVGAIERGTLVEVPGRRGHLGSLWQVTDVTVAKTAAGQVFNVRGNVRNVQPTDVVSAAMLDDTNIGVFDDGTATRGLEPQIGGEPGGLDDVTDESPAAAKRGTQPRLGGGTSGSPSSPILLSRGDEREE